MSGELKPITPQKSCDMYLKERREGASFETMKTLESGLDRFLEWCQEKQIDNMNNLTGRKLRKFKNWCKETTDNGIVSLNGICSVLRRFLVFCVKIEAVGPQLPKKTPVPNVPDDEDVSDKKPSDEQVEAALEYLEKYEPCSRRHVEFAIIEEISSRVGAIRSIDIKDIDLQERVIKFRHRPADAPDVKGTPLKNKKDGQRHVNISDELANLIKEYLESPNRYDVTDKFGREPLLTTKKGRPSVDTIRRDLYKLTRPCQYSDNCPHDREIESCEAVNNHHASKCPTSYTPHPLRRWSIEHQIDRGVAKELLCDRVDVSVPVLNEHYDRRSEERKRKHRLKTLEKLFDGYGNRSRTLTAEELTEVLSDEDGMIDPQAVMQLAEQDAHDGGPDESADTDTTETDQDTDENQMSLDSFGTRQQAFAHPVAVPVFCCATLWTWVPHRLRRELQHLTPESEPSLRPSLARTARGTAGYGICVALLSLNLALMGLAPA